MPAPIARESEEPAEFSLSWQRSLRAGRRGPAPRGLDAENCPRPFARSLAVGMLIENPAWALTNGPPQAFVKSPAVARSCSNAPVLLAFEASNLCTNEAQLLPCAHLLESGAVRVRPCGPPDVAAMTCPSAHQTRTPRARNEKSSDLTAEPTGARRPSCHADQGNWRRLLEGVMPSTPQRICCRHAVRDGKELGRVGIEPTTKRLRVASTRHLPQRLSIISIGYISRVVPLSGILRHLVCHYCATRCWLYSSRIRLRLDCLCPATPMSLLRLPVRSKAVNGPRQPWMAPPSRSAVIESGCV